ncbi:DUF2934 domain-containing protein [Lysobacter auxotrophicus]|uniref:DUF2934 domain-containing protein n=1 Tax=Lysobacter auxotrophicus TaxID=2992573 RepID=A0ABM8DD53_9GAMM|nr:DUF2934 domain-containing protein [Lysobacter auxotrophicus]BDU16528.1 hypothetical protein LA521A_17290 [Lysobacter auxotrophicus]
MSPPTHAPERDAARRARIERLAREIWESEGRPEGQALRHWGMAERLVEAEADDTDAPESSRKQGRRPPA